MKIRIQGNSLRIRLFPEEVNRFGEEGQIQEWIQFGPLPEERLVYSLEKADCQSLEARYSGSRVTVLVPTPEAEEWVSTGLVGLEGLMPIGDSQFLKILVEKDLKRSRR